MQEILRRQRLREQLKGDFGSVPELPNAPPPHADGGLGNERQQQLRELLQGGFGNTPELPSETLAKVDGLTGDYEQHPGDVVMLDDGQEYLEEIDDDDLLDRDDFLEGSLQLSSEQNLEIRFKALIVGVLLSVCWLYAFAKGQRRDTVLADTSQTDSVSLQAGFATEEQPPHESLRLADVEHTVLELEEGNQPESRKLGGTSFMLTAADRKPMRLAPITWTDATPVSLDRESPQLPSNADASNEQITGLIASELTSRQEPFVEASSGRPFAKTHKEDWGQPFENQHLANSGQARNELGVVVRFESADDSLVKSGVTGYQVIDDQLKIPVFEAPRESGRSYYSSN